MQNYCINIVLYLIRSLIYKITQNLEIKFHEEMEGHYRFNLPSCQFGPVDVEDLDRLCVFGQENRPCQREDFSVNNFVPVNQIQQNQFEEKAFAYCTDERWLTCTANECPLYDPNYYFNPTTVLPCAEDYYHGVPYGYCFEGNPKAICDAEDELEDYLYVTF